MHLLNNPSQGGPSQGTLQAKDLPEAWRAGMQAELGIAPSDDRNGCLQDVHWFFERIGGEFQGYTIGNILSAQFFAAAKKAHPNIRGLRLRTFAALSQIVIAWNATRVLTEPPAAAPPAAHARASNRAPARAASRPP